MAWVILVLIALIAGYWLEKREYSSIAETRGCLSRRSVPDTSSFDRGNYIKTLSSYSLRQTVAAF